MRELSLHILDLVENSLKAGAGKVEIKITEDTEEDLLTIEISDDGMGMDSEMVKKVCDPFVTSRKERNVGLGLALIKAATERCDGNFQVQSEPGKGTEIKAVFKHSHIDRAPLGDMAATLLTIIQANPKMELIYQHSVNGEKFQFSLEGVRREMGDALTHPRVLNFIYDYLRDNIKILRRGLD